MNSVKSVLIGQADNGYIAFITRPYKYTADVRVYGTWLEMFTDLGSYFAEAVPRKFGGTCNGPDEDSIAKCAEAPRRIN